MFGASTFVLGLADGLVALPVPVRAAMAALLAVLAASVYAALDEDVTSGEAAVAAAVTVPIAYGIQWWPPAWGSYGDVRWHVAAAGAAVLGCALVVRYRSPRAHPVLLVVFLTGGIGGLLFFVGLGVRAVFGSVNLGFVPWGAVAGSAAVAAWRVPAITAGTLFWGQWLAIAGTWTAVVPHLGWPTWALALAPVIGAMFAFIGHLAYERVAPWLKQRAALARARLR